MPVAIDTLVGGVLVGLLALWVVSLIALLRAPNSVRPADRARGTTPSLASLERAAQLAQAPSTLWTRRRRRSAIRQMVDVLSSTNADSQPFIPLLSTLVDEVDRDPIVARTALAGLGACRSRDAAAALIGALRSGRHPESLVARYLDQCDAPIGDLLHPLLQDPSPRVRYWGAALLSTQTPGLEVVEDLVALTKDADGMVRKAAVSSIADLRVPGAAEIAVGLLNDPVWFVRVHAARALGRLKSEDEASAVAALLVDREWWVRVAARDALVEMGAGVWRALVPYLDHTDEFARNGAAEILQNNGVLDSLLVLESATHRPSPEKIALLHKITAAGSARLTQAFAERLDAPLQARYQALVADLGLERAAC